MKYLFVFFLVFFWKPLLAQECIIEYSKTLNTNNIFVIEDEKKRKLGDFLHAESCTIQDKTLYVISSFINLSTPPSYNIYLRKYVILNKKITPISQYFWQRKVWWGRNKMGTRIAHSCSTFLKDNYLVFTYQSPILNVQSSIYIPLRDCFLRLFEKNIELLTTIMHCYNYFIYSKNIVFKLAISFLN